MAMEESGCFIPQDSILLAALTLARPPLVMLLGRILMHQFKLLIPGFMPPASTLVTIGLPSLLRHPLMAISFIGKIVSHPSLLVGTSALLVS